MKRMVVVIAFLLLLLAGLMVRSEAQTEATFYWPPAPWPTPSDWAGFDGCLAACAEAHDYEHSPEHDACVYGCLEDYWWGKNKTHFPVVYGGE